MVIADSLAVTGPNGEVSRDNPNLWPNRVAAMLGDDVDVLIAAGPRWTAAQAWESVTARDPHRKGAAHAGAAGPVRGASAPETPDGTQSDQPPAATEPAEEQSAGQQSAEEQIDALVLAVGTFDQVSEALPQWIRDFRQSVCPRVIRDVVDPVCRLLTPPTVYLTAGGFRRLSQGETDYNLARLLAEFADTHPLGAEASASDRPDSGEPKGSRAIPVVLIAPSPCADRTLVTAENHRKALIAARRWADRYETGYVELEQPVADAHRDGSANPDGFHYSWSVHEAMATMVAAELQVMGFASKDAAPHRAKVSR